MTKSTCKDISFLEMLNWVTLHIQIEKCVKIISTPRDLKMKHARVFQIALEGEGEISPSSGRMGNFGKARKFSTEWWKSV